MAAVGSERLAVAPAAPPAAAVLDDWLNWLEAGRGEHIDLGLERVREVATQLRLPRPAPLVVTVAGTNGKGSSVALLECIWRTAGYRVGAYTSPHLLRYTERIRIDGRDIDESLLCAAFARVERARGEVPLTYFEFGTLAALALFADAGLDVAILEVGLGGRLDAVNIVDPDVALIAAIGLDHEAWLGSTREAIAREKAGILRRGRPLVCSDHDLPASVLESAAAGGAEPAVLGADFAFEVAQDSWTWWSGPRVLAALPHPALDGQHQFRNAAGVLKVVDLLAEHLPVTPAQLHAALRDVVLRGRFHRVVGRFEYVMDVAHNPQAAEIFCATLAGMPPAPRTHALVGMLNTKNHREFLRPLLPIVDSWTFATLPGASGASAEALALGLRQIAPRAPARCTADVPAAHREILAQARDGERILVLGSFLTVGAMLRLLATGAP